MKKNSGWTSEEDKLLLSLAGTMAFQKISAVVHRSKSGCISRYHTLVRNGLAPVEVVNAVVNRRGGGFGIENGNRKRRQRADRANGQRFRVPKEVQLPIAESPRLSDHMPEHPLPFLDLEYGQCRYPLDDGLFCADPIHKGRYCAAHYRLCVQPLKR